MSAKFLYSLALLFAIVLLLTTTSSLANNVHDEKKVKGVIVPKSKSPNPSSSVYNLMPMPPRRLLSSVNTQIVPKSPSPNPDSIKKHIQDVVAQEPATSQTSLIPRPPTLPNLGPNPDDCLSSAPGPSSFNISFPGAEVGEQDVPWPPTPPRIPE